MSDPLHSDAWIASHSPIPAEKLHALGFITLIWNSAEIALFTLFAATTGLSGRMAWLLTHDLGDVAVCNRIRDVLAMRDFKPELKDAIKHSLDLYDVNRINRNQLTHFMPSGTRDGIELLRQKGPEVKPQPFASELGDLRRVADEIGAMNVYITGITNHLLALSYGQPPKPLPDKPSLPDRLWKPPPPNPRAPPRPPQSSQA